MDRRPSRVHPPWPSSCYLFTIFPATPECVLDRLGLSASSRAISWNFPEPVLIMDVSIIIIINHSFYESSLV